MKRLIPVLALVVVGTIGCTGGGPSSPTPLTTAPPASAADTGDNIVWGTGDKLDGHNIVWGTGEKLQSKNIVWGTGRLVGQSSSNFPPGQFPSGNPAQAPGCSNPNTQPSDCK